MLDFVGRLLIIPPPPRKPANLPATASSKRHAAGIKGLLSNPKILLTLGAVILVASSLGSVELFAASWLKHTWGMSESQIAKTMFALIIPNMISAAFVGWLSDRLPRSSLIAAGLVIHAFGAPWLPMSTSIPTLIVTGALFGATAPIISAPVVPHLTAIVDQSGGQSYARVYGIFNMAWSVGMMLGPFAVGLIKQRWGFFTGMATISTLCLLYAPLCYRFSSLDITMKDDKRQTELVDSPPSPIMAQIVMAGEDKETPRNI
jgi:MFS family permease